MTVLTAVAHEIRAERVTFMAGSIAYNAFVSLLPLLLLLLAVASTVGSESLEATLLSITNAAVTPGAGEVLVQEVRNASAEVSLIGIGFLVWGALRIFRSLDAAFSDVYETAAENTFADQMVDGLAVFVSMAAVLLVAAALETQVATDVGTGAGWVLQRLALTVGIGAALVPMYYLFPDEDDLSVVEVLPGVAVTAGGLVVFQSLFQLYVQYSSTAARGSILASILVFMTWLYFSGLILLVGAAVNAVLSNRSDDVNIDPVVGGVPKVDLPERKADAETVAGVQRLGDLLPDASDVEVVVDGESVPLAPPGAVEVVVEPSRLPFVDDTVSVRLAWESASEREE